MSRDLEAYKIFNQIGKGSFGKVYKGVHKLTGEEVALKFIEKKEKRSRDLKNLREENELLKKINHPNVIALKDVIETQKEIVIVTDYAGRDLSGVIEEVKRFPLDKVKDYSIQILNAMLYLNQNRIIHRDLKPQNILIKGNHIKLCDFGFAKKLSASTKFLQSMKGTPLYLAPEIVRETKYTEKVDIWSFGCIIYELFTGRTPYYANTYQKLTPMILYQQVQYPKEMPVDLKDLINSMLQKNPSARPDWNELKNHAFFKRNEPLKDKMQNGMKEIVSVEMPENPYVPELQNFPENKQNNRIPNRQQELIESRVIQKIENDNQLKSYEAQFTKIHSDLMGNIVDGKELRRDIIFLHKVKKVFHERSQFNPLVTNELLDATINILNILLKLRKNRNNNENHNEMGEDDDITQNEALVFGLLCLAKIEKNYEFLEKELKLIGKLVKATFNEIAINSQIDQQITEFVTEILLQNSTTLPIECIKTGLIVIGIIVNQAFTTLANSYMYFERVAEDNLLSKIARIYRKEEKYGTVMELLKTIIHPVKEFKSMTGNPHHNLPSKLQRVFRSLKEQVAEALLKTDFISEVSPLQVYGEKGTAIIDYCEILLQCLEVSPLARKQFLKHSYWPTLLNQKRLRAYLFAYNMIFLCHQNKSILSNEDIAKFTQETHENKLVNTSIVWMGFMKVKNKPHNPASTSYKKNLLAKVFDGLFNDEGVKKNNCIEVYGMLDTTTKLFDQPLIHLFYNFVTEIKPENYDEFKDSLQFVSSMFKKICDTNCTFKPNSKSLFLLMTLFTENQFISKHLRFEKSIQLFFYECISDFIKRQDFEYLENEFAENEIPAFVARLIQCLNFLIDVEDNQSKTTNLSMSAANLTKEIQTSGFYRVMFIDGLIEEQFYQHLRYSQRVISKTSASGEFVNFLGVKVIPMCKNYLNKKFEPLLVEISLFISSLARDHSQFNTNILETSIVKKIKEWLIDEKYSESVKEKALYLIGNLAKRSEFFFGEFEAHNLMEAILVCLKTLNINPKILKNAIYSIGNISFYSQKQAFFDIFRFYKEIEPMIPYFAKAFDLNDNYLRSNLISTVSNLLRYSSIFLPQLIKNGLVGNILKLACEGQFDQPTAGLIMSLVKKILPYEEFYQAFGVKELKMIYQRRQAFGGDGNETIKKIREVLVMRGELN